MLKLLRRNLSSAGKSMLVISHKHKREGRSCPGFAILALCTQGFSWAGDCVIVPNYSPPSLEEGSTSLPLTVTVWLAVSLSKSRFIHVLRSALASEFALTKRTWEVDVIYSMSEHKFYEWLFQFCLFLALFPVPWEQCVLQGPGSSYSSWPTSADWHEWEMNIGSCKASCWDFAVITAARLTNMTNTLHFQSELWKYNSVLNCHFALILVLVLSGWLLVNYLDHAIGEFQLLSSDSKGPRLKRNLSGN